jgi:hypothetical protein
MGDFQYKVVDCEDIPDTIVFSQAAGEVEQQKITNLSIVVNFVFQVTCEYNLPLPAVDLPELGRPRASAVGEGRTEA